MLLSLMMGLRPTKEATLSGHLGRAVHAAFLALVAEQDPARGEALHSDEQVKPFTCSSLLGARVAGGQTLVGPQDKLWLRLTSLEEDLSQFLLDRVVGHPPEKIVLEGQAFAVERLAISHQEHPLARQGRYKDLAQAHLLGKEEPGRQIDLDFLSPTTFRSGGRNVPLPLPGLVFGSLVEKWNAFSPVSLSPEARRFGEEMVAVSRYRLHTRLVRFGEESFQTGFVGQCRFVALSGDRYWLRVLHLLADYAFFAGVGYRTTMGLGQAKRAKTNSPLSLEGEDANLPKQGGTGKRGF